LTVYNRIVSRFRYWGAVDEFMAQAEGKVYLYVLYSAVIMQEFVLNYVDI